ncbi:MAG: hypothetical protein ACTHK7_15790 [Aureliella sp.]
MRVHGWPGGQRAAAIALVSQRRQRYCPQIDGSHSASSFDAPSGAQPVPCCGDVKDARRAGGTAQAHHDREEG